LGEGDLWVGRGKGPTGGLVKSAKVKPGVLPQKAKERAKKERSPILGEIKKEKKGGLGMRGELGMRPKRIMDHWGLGAKENQYKTHTLGTSK